MDAVIRQSEFIGFMTAPASPQRHGEGYSPNSRSIAATMRGSVGSTAEA